MLFFIFLRIRHMFVDRLHVLQRFGFTHDYTFRKLSLKGVVYVNVYQFRI